MSTFMTTIWITVEDDDPTSDLGLLLETLAGAEGFLSIKGFVFDVELGTDFTATQ